MSEGYVNNIRSLSKNTQTNQDSLEPTATDESRWDVLCTSWVQRTRTQEKPKGLCVQSPIATITPNAYQRLEVMLGRSARGLRESEQLTLLYDGWLQAVHIWASKSQSVIWASSGIVLDVYSRSQTAVNATQPFDGSDILRMLTYNWSACGLVRTGQGWKKRHGS